ncbi:hypothetical protein DNTS_034489 [Danionella cerebrum]|uniref:Interleukin n=1 Tax=Danionella cerebrum TaxID=2873325 RepID=A0A553MLL4_9TELE|nr:hypothetical protein DNTS_034489 [Danionella translucida]
MEKKCCLSALLALTEGQKDRYAGQTLIELQRALQEHKDLFKNSSALLYTPNIDRIKSCTLRFFDCFLMEMQVFLHDESRDFKMINTIIKGFSEEICSKRYPCELEQLTNAMEFFRRMEHYLQILRNLCQKKHNITCEL